MSKSLSKSRFIELFSESPKARLADTCKLINGDRGKNYPSSNDRVESGIPFINAGNLNGKNIDFSGMEYITEEKYSTLKTGKVQKGDILYCLRGSLGKIGLVDFDEGLIASSLVIIRCDQNKLLPDFLLCALGSNEVKQQLLKANNGSSQPNLSAASVKEYKVTCPSINEQKEFSEFIKQIDKSKFILQKMIEKLELLKKSRFIEMFGNVATNNKRWEKTKLGNKSVIGSSKRIFANEYTTEGIPFYRSKEIIELGMGEKPSVELYISKKRYQEIKEKFGIPIPGDILMTAVGTIGKFWIVPNSKPFYYKDGNLVYIRTKEFNPLFLKKLLEMLIEKYKVENANGSAYTALTIEKLKDLQIVLPPMTLQKQYEEFYIQIDKSKLILQKQLDDLVGETK